MVNIVGNVNLIEQRAVNVDENIALNEEERPLETLYRVTNANDRENEQF